MQFSTIHAVRMEFELQTTISFQWVLTNAGLLYILFIYSKAVTNMQIYIDNRSGHPIYDQIYSQLKSQILSGELPADQALPSIRGLAKDLRISVITTKRAYDELEKEGFLYTVAGKGSFVAPKNLELIREENLKKIEEHLLEIRGLAAACGLTGEDLVQMLRVLEEEA